MSGDARRNRIVALLLGAVLLPVTGAAAASEPATFNFDEVAPGIHVHRGVHAGLDDPRREDSANLAAVIGATCVAIVDSGGSIRIGEALRAALRAVTDRPVCYVINTHVHFDHVLGNAAFAVADPAPRFVGNARLAEAIAANRGFFAREFPAELAGRGEVAVIGPDTLVEDALTLDLGGRRLLLEAQRTAHTTQDLTVFDEQTRTLFTGDLVFMERIPALDGSLRGWVAVLDRLVERDVARAVPGHGPAFAPWPAAANDTRRYLGALLAQTRRAIADGVFLEDAIRTVGQSEREQWLLFDANNGRNVTRAYKELEWE
ncbi:MAG: quinoprotein relay system zinc metallohydrolase 2 [Gammaproteobacteria bacterium]|nr:quinoprotein relay system zinc metallohydrolase 2 [Gammaproteobacteria bacterium]